MSIELIVFYEPGFIHQTGTFVRVMNNNRRVLLPQYTSKFWIVLRGDLMHTGVHEVVPLIFFPSCPCSLSRSWFRTPHQTFQIHLKVFWTHDLCPSGGCWLVSDYDTVRSEKLLLTRRCGALSHLFSWRTDSGLWLSVCADSWITIDVWGMVGMRSLKQRRLLRKVRKRQNWKCLTIFLLNLQFVRNIVQFIQQHLSCCS